MDRRDRETRCCFEGARHVASPARLGAQRGSAGTRRCCSTKRYLGSVMKHPRTGARAAGTSKSAAAAGKVALFIETYLANGCNGAQAYRVAGFRAKNTNVAAV